MTTMTKESFLSIDAEPLTWWHIDGAPENKT